MQNQTGCSEQEAIAESAMQDRGYLKREVRVEKIE
jgi:hypothetical protein